MNERERAIRQALSIPDDATQVLILEQSAHCDWDWVATQQQYYACGGGGHQAVRETLTEAIGYIGSGSAPRSPYVYVFCEVGYLQSFWTDTTVPQSLKNTLAGYAGKSFLFSSGGITSAENLTLHTEAFIRNYLIGRQWLWDTFGVTASNQMWIPDDFGHDAQLPVLLQAMGFTGAGFWRIPAQAGAPGTQCPGVTPTANAASVFLNESVGLDFTWQANDGSRVIGHWLSHSYLEGNNIIGDFDADGYGGGDIPASGANASIQSLLAQQSTIAVPNPAYMFVPIDYDFTAPYSNLPSTLAAWNANPPSAGVYVVMASFDDFIQLTGAARTPPVVSPSSRGPLPPYIPHPYYSGCYGSKPLIKNAHYETVRTLLFAEAMQVVLQAMGSSSAGTAITMLATAWNEIAPSTHHDYIPGTSPGTAYPCQADESKSVYQDEQVTLIQKALSDAQAAQTYVLDAIAGALPAAASSVAIFNAVGFSRTAVADLAAPPAGGPFTSVAISANNGMYFPVQDDGNGGLLVQATVPSLGYTTLTLSTSAATMTTSLTASISDGVVTMSNGSIRAVIDVTGITALTDPNDPGGANHLGGAANLVFYDDGGNIYRFGMELPCEPAAFGPSTTLSLESPAIELTESGPLRATAVISGTVQKQQYTIAYQLYSTDTALRISVTGAAPSECSVMMRFPFVSAATSLTYGTTSHWDTQAPREYFDWTPPAGTLTMTFEPTHEFVAANGPAGILGAIYHYASPGWAIDPTGAVIGCLLRNTPGMQNATNGSDFGTYTVTLAVALPTGLQSPGNSAWGAGSMLAAALDLNNPLAAVAIPSGATGALPPMMSIASTTDPSALVTVAKVGMVDPTKLILRLYQPTNAPLSAVQVALDPLVAGAYASEGTLPASAVTAIEQPSNADLHLTTGTWWVQLDLPFAITTVALG